MKKKHAVTENDPFTGKWEFRADRSNAPGVRSWVQWIEATAEEVKVQEDLLSATGVRANVLIEARFDGKDYPVRGSSLADTIAYMRLGRRKITGTGKKNGSVTLREMITVTGDDETLTLTFEIFAEERRVIGFAVFERKVTSSERARFE